MSRIIPVSGMSLFEVLPHCFGLLTKAEVAALDIQIEMNCPSVQKEGSFHTHSRVTSHDSDSRVTTHESRLLEFSENSSSMLMLEFF